MIIHFVTRPGKTGQPIKPSVGLNRHPFPADPAMPMDYTVRNTVYSTDYCDNNRPLMSAKSELRSVLGGIANEHGDSRLAPANTTDLYNTRPPTAAAPAPALETLCMTGLHLGLNAAPASRLHIRPLNSVHDIKAPPPLAGPQPLAARPHDRGPASRLHIKPITYHSEPKVCLPPLNHENDDYIFRKEDNDNVFVKASQNSGDIIIVDQTEPVQLGLTPEQFAPIKDTYWPRLNSSQWRDQPTYAMLYSAIRRSCLPNRLGPRLTIPSGLNLDRWDELLTDYHDAQLCEYLRYGWPVGYTAPHPPSTVTTNHTSATAHPDAVRAFIEKELRLGGIIGPFKEPPFTPWMHIAPLMTRPKKATDERRVILDLSYPLGEGVNAGITKNCLEGRYQAYTLPSIDDLVQHVRIMGSGAWLWKADLSRAYMQLRLDPGDIPLLGLKFDGLIYLEVCPSFGCRLSGAACQRTTNAVVYLMRKAGYTTLAYLDDFCGIARTRQEAQHAYDAFIGLAADLGLALAKDKCQPPTQSMEWLGFHVDSITMTVSVPDDKLTEIVSEGKQWMSKKQATKKQVQSIAGKLVHVSRAIPHARKFISRILEALRKAPEAGLINISVSFKADIKWFIQYAAVANGVHLIDPDLTEYNIECDSSDYGGGGNSDVAYYRLAYTHAHCKKYPYAHQKEAVNLLIAYRTLRPQSTSGMRIVVHTDNMASKFALTTGKTKDPVLAACSRQLWLDASVADHTVEIRHKPGALIPLPDALSRFNEPSKRLLAKSLIQQKALRRLESAQPHPLFTKI